MNYSIVLDIVAVAVVVLTVGLMAKKGVIKSLYRIFSLVLTIVAVLVLSGPVEEMISSVGLDDKIDSFVSSSLITDDEIMQVSQEEENIQALPEYVTQSLDNVADKTVVPAVSSLVISLVCALIIFFVAKLIIFLVFMLVEGMFKLPLLNKVNWLLGAATGILYGLVIIYLACGIASLNVSNSANIRQIIDGTYIVKYFYDNNILMNLFLL